MLRCAIFKHGGAHEAVTQCSVFGRGFSSPRVSRFLIIRDINRCCQMFVFYNDAHVRFTDMTHTPYLSCRWPFISLMHPRLVRLSVFIFPVIILLVKLDSRRSLWVLGQCHVTSVCCETRVGDSRDGLTLPFFFFVWYPSSSFQKGGGGGGGEERKKGGDTQVTQFLFSG